MFLRLILVWFWNDGLKVEWWYNDAIRGMWKVSLCAFVCFERYLRQISIFYMLRHWYDWCDGVIRGCVKRHHCVFYIIWEACVFDIYRTKNALWEDFLSELFHALYFGIIFSMIRWKRFVPSSSQSLLCFYLLLLCYYPVKLFIFLRWNDFCVILVWWCGCSVLWII